MDGDEYLTVKYVNHSERGDNWIKLVSYNQYHQPKDFPLSSVKAMARKIIEGQKRNSVLLFSSLF